MTTNHVYRFWLIALLFQLAIPHGIGADESAAPGIITVIGMEYPRLAHFAEVQGEVKILVKVAHDGSVKDAVIIEGNRLLAEDAKRSAYRWRYSGCPQALASCEMRISFRFVLLDGTCDSSACRSEFQFDVPNSVTVRAKHFNGPTQ